MLYVPAYKTRSLHCGSHVPKAALLVGLHKHGLEFRVGVHWVLIKEWSVAEAWAFDSNRFVRDHTCSPDLEGCYIGARTGICC